MDDLEETALYDTITGLGNWHDLDEDGRQVSRYLANKEECCSCLQDLLAALKNDQAEFGYPKRLKLAQWRTLQDHLVPLFTSYRGDLQISTLALKAMAELTRHPDRAAPERFRHLEHLQGCKESFARHDTMNILLTMLLQFCDDAEGEAEAPEETSKPKGDKSIFEDALLLMRNLVTVPDPSPGDAGFTQTRKSMQLGYVQHFQNEGVLDFFLLFAETIIAEHNVEHAWALADVLYHICTQANPEELVQKQAGRDKRVLADLLGRDKVDSRLRLPRASRHSRFGTAMAAKDGQGGLVVNSSVVETRNVSKGVRLQAREYRDPQGRSEKKQNMFHDPFFVDLEEGSVRDHNQLNPHVKSGLEAAKTMGGTALDGLQKFFVELIETSFSQLIQLLRGSLISKPSERPVDDNIGRPMMLNLNSWILEFHRHKHKADVARAKSSKKDAPPMDITAIQGAIDLDMLQFIAARLRQYGKESNFHASHLVIVLRALHQQVKTVTVLMESKDADFRSCGEVLTQNFVKEDVMAHLGWIFKNFKSSSHDPRILSYAVEVFHHMLQLMGRVVSSKSGEGGEKLEFQIERVTGLHTKRPTTTVEKEIASLADARVVENLFYLLEKYKRHSAQLNSMLVKLIYQIIKAERTNIVVFFELSYFFRIHRICSDPWVTDRAGGGGGARDRYREMVQLLQHILRQFFKCAEKNGCGFVELLFRKTPENAKEALLGDHRAEFAAILDDYEEEEYKRIMERVEAGETLNAMRERQRAQLQALDGNAPWTSEEDALLQERYPVYADHALCAELLAAELPEDSHRTARQVRKRLVDLGLLRRAQRGPEQVPEEPEEEDAPPHKDAGMDDAFAADGPPAKRQKLPDAADAAEVPDATVDEADLEMDLERLLDAAMDEDPGAAPDADAAADGLDLEMELEALLEGEVPTQSQPSSQAPRPSGDPPAAAAAGLPAAGAQERREPAATAPEPSATVPERPEPGSLEAELDALMESVPENSQSQRPQDEGAAAPAEGARELPAPEGTASSSARAAPDKGTPQAGAPPAEGAQSTGAAMPPPETEPPASAGAMEPGSLEAELDALMESVPADSQSQRQPEHSGAAAAADAKQASELDNNSQIDASAGAGGDSGDLELDLEKLLDEDAVPTQPGAPEAGGA